MVRGNKFKPDGGLAKGGSVTKKKKKKGLKPKIKIKQKEIKVKKDAVEGVANEVNGIDVQGPAEENQDLSTRPAALLKPKWTNRERVLVFCGRGATFRDRHLMVDLKTMMPHAKGESKFDKNVGMPIINEIAEMKNCSKCLYFENRKRKDLYCWAANVGKGPSVKFLVHNVHTMSELRLTGNSLKGSRPLLSFDAGFDREPHLKLIKELFTQTFGTPNHHPRSQPFVDHILQFSLTPDGRIWFRNFQIVDEKLQLQEIGPRMVLEIIKVFAGSFEGAVLYENTTFNSPNLIRRQMKLASSHRSVQRLEDKAALKERKEGLPDSYKVDPLDSVFDTNIDEAVVDSTRTVQSLKRKLEAQTKKHTKVPKKESEL